MAGGSAGSSGRPTAAFRSVALGNRGAGIDHLPVGRLAALARRRSRTRDTACGCWPGDSLVQRMNGMDRPQWPHHPLFLLRVAFDHLLFVAIGVAMVVLVLETGAGPKRRAERQNAAADVVDRCQHADVVGEGSAGPGAGASGGKPGSDARAGAARGRAGQTRRNWWRARRLGSARRFCERHASGADVGAVDAAGDARRMRVSSKRR